jgi:hypothetical protein
MINTVWFVRGSTVIAMYFLLENLKWLQYAIAMFETYECYLD